MVESTPQRIKAAITDKVKVTIDEYNQMFPNIESEYFNLQVAGYYLPEMKFCSRYFLRGIFTGQQDCPKTTDMKPTHVKRYKEVSIKLLLASVGSEPEEKQEVFKYLPKVLKDKKVPRLSRNWLITICNTFAPKALKKVLDLAEKKHEKQAEKQGASIELCTAITKEVIGTDFAGIAYNNKHSKKRVRTFKPTYADISTFDQWIN